MPERFDWPNAVFKDDNLSVALLREESPEWCRALHFYLSDVLDHLIGVGADAVRVNPTSRTLVLTNVIGNAPSLPPIVAQSAGMADEHEARQVRETAQAWEAVERSQREQAEADERRTREIREAAKVRQ